jgi:hypothetical protein
VGYPVEDRKIEGRIALAKIFDILPDKGMSVLPLLTPPSGLARAAFVKNHYFQNIVSNL